MINRPILIAAGAAVAVLAAASPSLAGAPAATITTVTASAATLTTSQTVDLTAKITSSPVQVCWGVVRYERAGFGPVCSTAVETAALGTSTAHVCRPTGASLGVGTHTITAAYDGGGVGCPASISAPMSVTVTAAPAPAAVPTVGEWTMWGLAGVLLIGGGVVASRRFRATAA